MKALRSLPETIVAVVGDTGAGKSSLMNALLEHSDILPTSGLQACTSVAVEVSANTTDDKYRAEIEFLEKQVHLCLNRNKDKLNKSQCVFFSCNFMQY